MARIDRDDIIKALSRISRWCVFLIIFALPFSKSIIEICVSVGIAAVLIRKIMLRERLFADTPLNLALLLFLAASSLSFFNTEFLFLSLRALVSKYLKFVLFYFVVVEAIDTRAKLDDLLKICLLSMCVITIDGYIQYFVTHIDLLHDYPSFKYIASYKDQSF
ncbi:hypothetical protein ACFL3N_03210, partial [Candidatus Omnitrophota bacterium]